MQKKITVQAPLLDQHGHLTCVGYAKKLFPIYERSAIQANRLRIKEWDYYLVYNDRFALALTIADNSYMGLSSISFLDFTTPCETTVSAMTIFPMGKTGFPSTSEKGNVQSKGKGYQIDFENDGKTRHLVCHMEKFKNKSPIDADLLLTDAPEESMVIMTPFQNAPKAFYFNQKINCMKVTGKVILEGKEYVFQPSDSFGILDWGRGVWTYSNTWYWGSGSGLLNGVPFGFNIGYGFGDTSAATENMLFYNGKSHKLSQVTFDIPTKDEKDDYMRPWKFSSDDGRFEMDFNPILDRKSCTNVGLICSDQHQVFGKFSGKAVLDDNSVLAIHDFMGFAEKVKNRW